MVAPIFRFRNVKTRLVSNQPTFVYGVNTYIAALADRTLAEGIFTDEISTVLLTVQISNITGLTGSPTDSTVNVSAYIQNSTTLSGGVPLFDAVNSRLLVHRYPLISNNAFDPLSGNLVLATHDQLWIQCDTPVSCDVTASLLEIANATAS
jgi:hypothetical protein